MLRLAPSSKGRYVPSFSSRCPVGCHTNLTMTIGGRTRIRSNCSSTEIDRKSAPDYANPDYGMTPVMKPIPVPKFTPKSWPNFSRDIGRLNLVSSAQTISERATATRLVQTSFACSLSPFPFSSFFRSFLPDYWVWPGVFGRKLLLVIASCFFYAAWDWTFLSLLDFVVVTTFAASWRILYLKGRGARVQSLVILWIGIGVQLAVLAFFKYFNFFEDNLVKLLSGFGLPSAAPIVRTCYQSALAFTPFTRSPWQWTPTAAK